MVSEKTYRVTELARLSGVTVRTLHHYDAIGLLRPKRRTAAGYRLYSAKDVLLLQQILIYRQLGMPLERIKAVVTDATFDRRTALLEQRQQLQAKADHTQAMIRAVDAALTAMKGIGAMNASELFDGFDPKQYEQEAEQRWGHSDAYKESARRTKGYSKDDGARIKTANLDLMQRIAALLAAGHEPGETAAMDLAEEHRLHIDRFYYPCSHIMHDNLGQMYTADVRFQDNLDKFGSGVAAFLQAAIAANAKRAAG